MCGIVAFICNSMAGFNQNEIDAFKDMLHVNALRGMDSTGIFYTTNQNDVQIHKDVKDSPEFLKTEEWKKSSRELLWQGVAAVGHCRAATRGAKKDDNAHPFIVDNKIVLVHNGTYVGNHKDLADTEVDSHAIAHVLAQEPNIATALQKINAAFALIWYNVETGMLHVVRNDERPLYVATTANQAMMIASEPSMIYFAAHRNGIKLDEHGAVLLGRHNLLSVNLKNLKENYDFKLIEADYKPPVKESTLPFLETVPAKTAGGLDATKSGPGQQRTHSKTGSVEEASFHDRRRTRLWKSKTFITMCQAARLMGIGDWTPTAEHQTVESVIKKNERIIVEPIDYCSSDDTLGDNNHYYVFGRIISVDEKKEQLIAGWEITADSELDVVNYCDSILFDGTVEFSMSMPYNEAPSFTSIVKLSNVKACSLVPVDLIQ